ncbi:MAG: ABC transporter permease [Alphaproteobacteria bacterium]|nr:ABC transporter permease [Alphaproteobacteria bacterium]
MRAVLRRFATGGGIAGTVLFALVVLAALLAAVIAPGDPMAMAGRPLIQPFSDWRFPLGTDRLGRDVLAELLHGARATLIVSGAAALVTLLVGITIGTLAGFIGGRLDDALMRLADAFQSVPTFILALAFVSIAGPSLASVVTAVSLGAWTAPARVLRAEILSLRRREFVDAYRVLGMPPLQIAFREVLPNALPPVITLAAVIVANAILVEAALSFLGLGNPNSVTWGAMIAEGRAVIRSAPYLSAIPGVAVVVTVLAVNLIGDAANEAIHARRVQVP